MPKNVIPDKDTGWGLIYRLNNLFNQVELLAPKGQYDEWNFKLDRIFINLAYREKLKIIKKDDEVTSVEYDEEAFSVKSYFDKQISLIKKKMRTIKKDNPDKEYTKTKEYILEKNNLYNMTNLKEVWLRKYMQQLGLYLKEVENNPGGSMFGR